MKLPRQLSALVALALSATACSAPAAEENQNLAKVMLAGGCFWCMEPPYEKLPGVKSVVSGYAGGHDANPNYRSVSAGYTGHTEVVEITYDPNIISYPKLLETFWLNIDPFVKDRQFCDRGSQYRSAIFYKNASQKRLAEQTKAAIEQKFGRTVHTEIVADAKFFEAESYHQDYYKKNPERYYYYRTGCGRDRRLEQIWSGKQNWLKSKF